MAVEERRGCGFRQVGGMYLVGGAISVPCDRLPYPLPICPACGSGIKVNRGFTRINPLKAFGEHVGMSVTIDEFAQECVDAGMDYSAPLKSTCIDKPICFMCYPKDEVAYIMLVGEKFYSTKSFMEEAGRLGVSKRIPFIPQEFKVGNTVIYLAHNKACVINGDGETDKKGRIKMLQDTTGIFTAFIPQRIEKLVWESQLTGKKGEDLKKRLEKQGITPIGIPDEDEDHI